MHAGDNHGFIQLRHFLQGFGIVAGDDLQDLGDGVLLVAGVDALGRVGDVEVLLPFHAGVLFQQRDAHLLGGARVDRGFVHHDGALLHVLADGGAGTHQGAEIRLVRLVHRGGHGDDDEVAFLERGRVRGAGELGGGLQVFGGHLAGGVAVALVVLDFFSRQIDPDGAEFLAEFHGERQAHVTQADDAHDAHVEDSSSWLNFPRILTKAAPP